MASVNGFYVWAGLLGFDKRIDSATLLGQEAWIPGSCFITFFDSNTSTFFCFLYPSLFFR